MTKKAARKGKSKPAVIAAVAPGPDPRFRVYKVLASWAHVSVANVPPDTNKIVDLYTAGHGNVPVDDDLNNLITDLDGEFGTELGLNVTDLADHTVNDLVMYVVNNLP